MKNKCCIKGCAARGQWIWHTGIAYCQRHKPVLLARHGRGHRYPFAQNNRYVGRVHEGKKVGKPRAWKEAADAKGV